jgi:hypothetical protein
MQASHPRTPTFARLIGSYRTPAVIALTIGLLVSGISAAQSGPTLQDLAVAWARGSYGSPLICEIDGQPVRGMRRVQIVPAARKGRLTEARVIFVEMDVSADTRCFNDLGEAAPNISGAVRLRLPGPSREDTAKRDFKQLLRRTGGVEFDVTAGRLRLQAGGAAPESPDTEDFSGGKAFLETVGPGSDSYRLLADFASPRKLSLELRSKKGTLIRLPLFLTEIR